MEDAEVFDKKEDGQLLVTNNSLRSIMLSEQSGNIS